MYRSCANARQSCTQSRQLTSTLLKIDSRYSSFWQHCNQATCQQQWKHTCRQQTIFFSKKLIDQLNEELDEGELTYYDSDIDDDDLFVIQPATYDQASPQSYNNQQGSLRGNSKQTGNERKEQVESSDEDEQQQESEELYFIKQLTRDDVQLNFSRSSGPGGQNVNKVETKVDARLNLNAATWLSRKVRAVLEKKYPSNVTQAGEFTVKSQKYRTQYQNIDDAMLRMQNMLETAAKEARPKKVSDAKKKRIKQLAKKYNEERLGLKKKQGEKKTGRKMGKNDFR